MKTLSYLAVPAALAASLLTGAPAEAGKICKATYSGSQTLWLPGKALAEASAASRWSTGVAKRYSLAWSNWGNASAKSYSCRKKTSVIGTNGWKCRATARPCKYE